MAVVLKDIPFFPKPSLDGSPRSKFPSQSAEMVSLLKKLTTGKCIEVTRTTDHPKDLERKRAHWITSARRAKIAIVTKIVDNEVGDRVLRIWRRPE